MKRRPSQEEECLCIESVFIMLDKTIFLDLRHSVRDHCDHVLGVHLLSS